MNLTAVSNIYINENVWLYYKKLRTTCSKLWDTNRILYYRVSNESVRVKLVKEHTSIITHDTDLEKLFPVDPFVCRYLLDLYRLMWLMFAF